MAESEPSSQTLILHRQPYDPHFYSIGTHWQQFHITTHLTCSALNTSLPKHFQDYFMLAKARGGYIPSPIACDIYKWLVNEKQVTLSFLLQLCQFHSRREPNRMQVLHHIQSTLSSSIIQTRLECLHQYNLCHSLGYSLPLHSPFRSPLKLLGFSILKTLQSFMLSFCNDNIMTLIESATHPLHHALVGIEIKLVQDYFIKTEIRRQGYLYFIQSLDTILQPLVQQHVWGHSIDAEFISSLSSSSSSSTAVNESRLYCLQAPNDTLLVWLLLGPHARHLSISVPSPSHRTIAYSE